MNLFSPTIHPRRLRGGELCSSWQWRRVGEEAAGTARGLQGTSCGGNGASVVPPLRGHPWAVWGLGAACAVGGGWMDWKNTLFGVQKLGTILRFRAERQCHLVCFQGLGAISWGTKSDLAVKCEQAKIVFLARCTSQPFCAFLNSNREGVLASPPAPYPIPTREPLGEYKIEPL